MVQEILSSSDYNNRSSAIQEFNLLFIKSPVQDMGHSFISPQINIQSIYVFSLLRLTLSVAESYFLA